MDDLVERLRGSLYACNAVRGYLDDAGFPTNGDAHGQLAEIEAALTEAAAALEAAREDAERYRWLRSLNGACDAAACVTFNIGFDWIEQHGAELDAAIDQARGKGGQEVGNG